MSSGTRKEFSPGRPTPAPKTPPRLLSESRSTSAALALLEKGIKLIYQKEYKRARRELQSIGEAYPGETEIIVRSDSYLQICAREEASRKKQPVVNDQLYSLGVMEHNIGNYEDAISYFQQFRDKHPDADYVYYSLAASQVMRNDVSNAIRNLTKAIQLNEDNRIYARNDSDFTPLQEQKEFSDLVGMSRAVKPEQS